MRDTGRFGVLAMLGEVVLAAVGLRVVLRSLGRWRHLAGAAVSLAVVLEVMPLDIGPTFSVVPPPPPLASWLAAAPRGVVLELPWSREASDYLYWSTVHWQPMVNGFGAFVPPGNAELGRLGKRFPEESVVSVLRGVGVRYVVVHAEWLTHSSRILLFRTPLPQGVRHVADSERGDARIYVIDAEGPQRIPGWLRAKWDGLPILSRP